MSLLVAVVETMCSCGEGTPTAAPPIPQVPSRTSLSSPSLVADDVAIYELLLSGRNETRLHVVREFHVPSPSAFPDPDARRPDAWAPDWIDVTTRSVVACPVPVQMLRELPALLAAPGSLPAGLTLREGWQAVNRGDYERGISALFASRSHDREDWIAVVGPEGTLEFSRIVYSADGTWALVWSSWNGGPMAGGSGLRALQRSADGWQCKAWLPLESS
jgi:hypothetical protein